MAAKFQIHRIAFCGLAAAVACVAQPSAKTAPQAQTTERGLVQQLEVEIKELRALLTECAPKLSSIGRKSAICNGNCALTLRFARRHRHLQQQNLPSRRARRLRQLRLGLQNSQLRIKLMLGSPNWKRNSRCLPAR